MKNKAILIGNVGQDPEFKDLGNGNEMCKFSLATSETWKDKKTGEKQQKTQWHNIVAFGKVVNVIKQYVNKGDKLYIEGQIEYNKYEKDSETKYFTQIKLFDLIMLGSPKDNFKKNGGKQYDEYTDPDAGGDDLPY